MEIVFRNSTLKFETSNRQVLNPTFYLRSYVTKSNMKLTFTDTAVDGTYGLYVIPVSAGERVLVTSSSAITTTSYNGISFVTELTSGTTATSLQDDGSPTTYNLDYTASQNGYILVWDNNVTAGHEFSFIKIL